MITLITDCKPGDKVRNKLNGNTGVITKFDTEYDSGHRHGWCTIDWDNGKKTSQPLWDDDYGEMDGRGAMLSNVELI